MSENGTGQVLPACRYCAIVTPSMNALTEVSWHGEHCAVRQIGADPFVQMLGMLGQHVDAQAQLIQQMAAQLSALCEVSQSLLNHALGNPVEPRPELLAALGVKPNSRPLVVVPGVKFN